MNRCPITYEECFESKYSKRGLRLLSPKLKLLKDFPYTPQEQIELAALSATKLSIQGIQPKLSVKLNSTKETFEMVERGGNFILKPPHLIYEELPQNEDLTMRLAQIANIEVPLHGMIYNKDQSLTYFIKRFDRLPRGQKLAVEDFSQLLGLGRETKYDSSMEKLIPILDKYCTFPYLEKIKLFRLVIFNFLVGNEDMHLKNFSLIRRQNEVSLSPVYDLLNSSIAMLSFTEEVALPIKGKKSKLTYADLVEYWGGERLGLSSSILESELGNFKKAYPNWLILIEHSFLSPTARQRYSDLLKVRWNRLFNNLEKTIKNPM